MVRLEPFALLGLEPLRVRGFLREIAQHHEPQDHRRQPFTQEHPLPAVQSEVSFEA